MSSHAAEHVTASGLSSTGGKPRGGSTEDTGGAEVAVMATGVVWPLDVACAVAGGGTAKVSAQPYGSEPASGSNVPRSMLCAGAGAGLGIVAAGEQSVF